MDDRPVVGVRYCGGCNPRYDRTAALHALEEQFPGLRFLPAAPGQPLTLVICGCAAQCADVSDLEGEVLRLWAPGLPDRAVRQLERLQSSRERK